MIPDTAADILATPARERFVYRAFISYSHVDHRFADRLYRRLLAYRVPADLADGIPSGPLGKFYLDKESLGAAPDLPTALEAALAASGSLIVVASAGATASRWVGKEIAAFRRLRPDGRIYYIAPAGQDAAACRALFAADPANDGAVTNLDMPREPVVLAVDPIGFGEAALTLIAELLDVEPEKVRNRELRRQRRVMRRRIILAAAITLAIVLLGILSFIAAIKANRETAKALAGQAELLATLSGEALRANDATLAVRLALSALPSANSARPYAWQAGVALHRAAQQLRASAGLRRSGERLVLFAPSRTYPGAKLLVSEAGVITMETAGQPSKEVTIPTAKPHVNSAYYLARSALVVLLSGNDLVSWDERTGRFLRITLPEAPDCLTVSEDERVATTAHGKRVQTFRLPGFTPLHDIALPPGRTAACAAYSAAQGRIVLGYLQGHRNGIGSIDISSGPPYRFRELGEASDMIVHAAVDRTGGRAAFAVGDGSLWIVDITSNTLRKADLPVSNKLAVAVAFTSNGQRIVSGNAVGMLQFYDATTLRRVAVLAEHVDFVMSIHPDDTGAQVYTAGLDGIIRSWDPEPMLLQRPLQPRHSGTLRTAGSESGRYLATSSMEGDVTVWDMKDAQPRGVVLRACPNRIDVLSLSEKAGMAAAVCEDGRIVGITLDAQPVAKPLYRTDVPVVWLAFTPRGELLFAGKRIFGIIAPSGKVDTVTDARDWQHIAPIGTTTRALVTDRNGDALVYDFVTRAKVHVLADPARGPDPAPKSMRPLAGVVSGDGRHAWVAGIDDRLRSWDVQTGQLLAVAPLSAMYGDSLAPGPRDDLAYVEAGKIYYWRAGMPKPEARFIHTSASAVSFLPLPDERIVASSIRPEIWLLDIATGMPAGYVEFSVGGSENYSGRPVLTGNAGHPLIAYSDNDGFIVADQPPPVSELVVGVARYSSAAATPLESADLARFFLPTNSILQPGTRPVIGYAPIDTLVENLLRAIGKLDTPAPKLRRDLPRPLKQTGA